MIFHPFLTMTSCSSDSCPHSSWKPPRLRGICGSLPPPLPLVVWSEKNTWFVPHPWVQLEPFELSFNDFSSIFDPDKLLKFMPTFQLEAPQSWRHLRLSAPCPLPLVVWSMKNTWFVPHPWVQLEPFELSFNDFSSIFDPDKLLKFMPTFQLEAPQRHLRLSAPPPLAPCGLE